MRRIALPAASPCLHGTPPRTSGEGKAEAALLYMITCVPLTHCKHSHKQARVRVCTRPQEWCAPLPPTPTLTPPRPPTH